MIMMINSSADADAIFLPEWFAPSDRDVVCGWARQNHKHPGNMRFRRLVEHSAPLYVAAKTKLEKTQVIASVVDKVRRDSPGGGFVKRDFHTGLWYEIGDDKARDKVGHAIRRAIEEGKKPTSKSSEAKSKKGSGDKKSESPSSLKLPSASLDDFDDGEPQGIKKNSKGKNMEFGEGKLSSPFMTPQPYQDKSDSLVVPSFLYQQASALSGMQQDPSFGGSGAGAGLDHGRALNLQTSGAMSMFNHQNNAQLLDVLNQQSAAASARNDIQGRFSHMNQLNQSGFQGKLSVMNSSDSSKDVKGIGNSFNPNMGNLTGNFLPMSNSQSLQLDQLNAFGAANFGASGGMNPNTVLSSQAANLDNFMQFGASSADLQQYGLSVLPSGTNPMDGNQGITGESYLTGGRGSNGLGFLPSLPLGASTSGTSNRQVEESSLWQQQNFGRGNSNF